MTDPLKVSGDTSRITLRTMTPEVPTFILLPHDVLVKIFVLLSMHDVLSLRQVCKALEQATRIRALWVQLARPTAPFNFPSISHMAKVLHLTTASLSPKSSILLPLTTSPLLHSDRPLPSAFATLPGDLLVTILGSVDIRDIMSLRRVSRAFHRATKLRSLWVLLVHREVLDRKLSWPSYASPLTIVPTKAIEEYIIRATKIARQWAPGSESQRRTFSRCIIRPPNSIGWLRVVKGRWLILELREKQLEVWDLQNDQGSEPVASYRGLKGVIDGSCITSAESSVTIILSTSSYGTNHLSINLPYLGDTGPTPNFTLLDDFEGYSGILDSRAGLAVFSRSVSNSRPLVRDMRTGSIVYFGSSEATQRPQRVLSARILKEHIVLMTAWTMEIYSIAKILSLMMYGHDDTSPTIIHANQSLFYPGGEMVKHVTVLDLFPEPSSKNGESEFCVAINVRRFSQWMRLHVRLGSNSDSPAFTSSMHPLFNTMELRNIACCWGGSGQRMLLALSHKASIRVFCGGRPSNSNLLYPNFDDHTAFEWYAVRDGEKDLFAGFAFDEVTGVCVVATSSGRIRIDDFSKPSSACKDSEDNLYPAETLLHPDPLWPLLHRLPWPANVSPDNHISDIRSMDPMPWSAEVDHHFPMMNDPDCYGGARWFVNEALRVSGPASLVMFTVSALYPRWCWSTRILQIAGGRLVAVRSDLDSASYRAKLLPADTSLAEIPDLFSNFFSIEIAAGVDLGVDYAIVRRYMFWRSQVEEDPEIGLELW